MKFIMRNIFVFFLSFVIAQSAFGALTDGLMAYYPFNGNANDESGNGNNGTVNGATLTTDRFGDTDSAYSFNESYIAVPDNPSLFSDNLTTSWWVNIESHTTSVHKFATPACHGFRRLNVTAQPRRGKLI